MPVSGLAWRLPAHSNLLLQPVTVAVLLLAARSAMTKLSRCYQVGCCVRVTFGPCTWRMHPAHLGCPWSDRVGSNPGSHQVGAALEGTSIPASRTRQPRSGPSAASLVAQIGQVKIFQGEIGGTTWQRPLLRLVRTCVEGLGSQQGITATAGCRCEQRRGGLVYAGVSLRSFRLASQGIAAERLIWIKG